MDLWASVDAARSRVEKASGVPPPNSFGISEYADKFGIHKRTALEQLDRLVKAGELAVHRCYAPTRAGSTAVQKFYTIKDKKCA